MQKATRCTVDTLVLPQLRRAMAWHVLLVGVALLKKSIMLSRSDVTDRQTEESTSHMACRVLSSHSGRRKWFRLLL